MRLAGGLPRMLREAKHLAMPSNIGELAMRIGPDALFSGLYAASVPKDYANGMERAGLFTEDFLSQSVPGLAAAALAGGLSRRFGARPGMARTIAGFADMAGSMAGPMLSGPMGLRPMQNALDQRAMQNAELQRQMELEGVFQQGLNAAAQGMGQMPMVRSVDSAWNALSGGYG